MIESLAPSPPQLLHDRPFAAAARATAPRRQLERPPPQRGGLVNVLVLVAAPEGQPATGPADAVAAAGARHRHALQAGRDGREQVQMI